MQDSQGMQAVQGIHQGTQAATGIQPNMGSQAIQGMQDIHDIKPPVPVGIDAAVLKGIIAVIVVLLCLIAGYFLFRYIKKRLKSKKKSNIMFLPPPLPADQAALRELESIADLMMREPRLYYFRLTAVVKTFIGKVFNINAPEMTTQEIIATFNTLDIEKKIISPAKEFFLSASMVKYAAVIPDIEQMKSDESFVTNFIDSVMLTTTQSTLNQVPLNLKTKTSNVGEK